MEVELIRELIEGAYDLHVHTGPDVQTRKLDDLEMSERVIASGMAGYVIKSHYFTTANRAKTANELYPQCDTIGSVTLNNSVGGLNAVAVEVTARAGGKMVWMPSVDSAYERVFLQNWGEGKGILPYWVKMIHEIEASGVPCPGISLRDENGDLKKEVYDILEVAKKYRMCVATSHLAHEDTFALAKAARDVGFERLLISHVTYPSTTYTLDELKELVSLGALLEYSYSTITTGKTTFEATIEGIRAIGEEHCIISSDLGMPNGETPEIGMLKFASMLYAGGISAELIHRMNRENPIFLVKG